MAGATTLAEFDDDRRVYPSGLSLATYSAPMAPLDQGLLTRTKSCP
jgi:hypothetical protein